jgi:hypothetical protein
MVSRERRRPGGHIWQSHKFPMTRGLFAAIPDFINLFAGETPNAAYFLRPQAAFCCISEGFAYKNMSLCRWLWRDRLKAIGVYIIQSRKPLSHVGPGFSPDAPAATASAIFARAKARAHMIKWHTAVFRYSVPLAPIMRDLRVLIQSLETRPHT